MKTDNNTTEEVGFFEWIAKIISMSSTTGAFTGIFQGISDTTTSMGFGFAIGLFFGAYVAFIMLPRMMRERAYLGIAVLVLILSATYSANTALVRGFMKDGYMEKHYLLLEQDTKLIKDGESLLDIDSKVFELNTTVNNLKLEIERKTPDTSEYIQLVQEEYAEALKHKKHGKWWDRNSAITGCTDLASGSRNAMRTHRKQCVAKYRAKQKAPKELISDLKTQTVKLNSEIQRVARSERENGSKIIKYKEALVRYDQAKKEADENISSFWSVAIFLFLLGFAFEGLITGFDLIMRVRAEKQLRTVIKTINEKGVEPVKVAETIKSKNTGLLEYLANSVEYHPSKNIKTLTELYALTVWQKRGVARKRKAIYNAFLGAWIYALDKGIEFKKMTEDNILEMNDPLLGLNFLESVNVAIPRLGSTAIELQIGDKKLNPQTEVLNFLRSVDADDTNPYNYIILAKKFMNEFYN